MSEFKTAIEHLAGTYQKDEVRVVVCIVESVNEAQRTCTVRSINTKSELSFSDVQLMAGVNDGFLLVPAIDSQVVVTYSTITQPFVSMFSELSKVIAIVGDNSIEVNSDNIFLSGDDFGGLVKVAELVDKLNNLENDINNLKAAFTSWVVAPNDGGAALKAAAATWYGSQLTPTIQNDLENETIQHGSGI